MVEVDVTSVSRYVAFYETTRTNKNAKKILIKELSPEEEAGKKRDFSETSSARDKIVDFLKFLSGSSPIKSELSADDFDEINETLTSLVVRLNARRWTEFLDWKETSMLNSAINKFRSEVSKKTGTPYLPTTTGFREYALNRIKIEICSTKISQGLNTKIPPQVEEVGSLGTSKGNLEYRTEFHFQTGSVIDSSLVSLTKVKKTPQKEFASLIGKISQNAYSSDLFQLIASLNQIEDVESIKTVHELLLFKRYFSLGGSAYFPSSGEASMLMLQKELGAEKEVYILDEPERSLGNEYISDVIVPMIKDRARAGKKIFISTHDANIAVRTLPYGSIYRCHDGAGYSTYIGNPFASDLVRVDDSTDRLDWREVSMRTLEGGREAFGERGNIYGRT